MQAEQTKDCSAVDHTIADDFQGIATNGDFSTEAKLVESAKRECRRKRAPTISTS